MGLDARILFRTEAANFELGDCLPARFAIQPVDACWLAVNPEATHQIDCGGARYYGEGYERGPWHEIAPALILLFSNLDVERVWYGGDEEMPLPEITRERVLRLTAFYMEHGTRPYYG